MPLSGPVPDRRRLACGGLAKRYFHRRDLAAERCLFADGHGGAAMVTLLLLGALIPVHVMRAWRSRKNRVSGSAMVTFNAVLIVTAFGLYYLGSETLRPG